MLYFVIWYFDMVTTLDASGEPHVRDFLQLRTGDGKHGDWRVFIIGTATLCQTIVMLFALVMGSMGIGESLSLELCQTIVMFNMAAMTKMVKTNKLFVFIILVLAATSCRQAVYRQ